ncbi:MAG TPA: glycosyltransferase family 39 protein [Gemmatimonadaceae bacterium]|nr:glycosyltransferase family 39 protein [Gemmatimonadaceae bacterium]
MSAFAGVTRSAAWLVLGAVGQAAALQLVEAGPTVRYQHYVAPGMLLSRERVGFLAIIVVQALICSIAMTTQPAIRNWLRTTFSAGKLVCMTLVFVLASAALSRSLQAYAFELAMAALVQVSAFITVVMAVLALPMPALHSFWRRAATVLGADSGDSRPTPEIQDRFALVQAVIVTIVAAILSVVSYERHPHIPDEVAYVLNARYFAAGMLYMPAPPVPAAFDVDLMQLTPTQWFSSMPPGWPAVLAIGSRVNLPWLVNPLLAGINVVVAYAFLREMYQRRTARLALLLLCVSPWYLFMGMNFMTHTFSLTAALVGALAAARLIRTGRFRWAWIGGAAVGILSLTRPLEGLLMLILLSLWTLTTRAARHRIVGTAFIVAGSVVVGALVLPYNKALTGRMTELPLTAYVSSHYAPGSNDLGFGPDRGWGWTGLDPFHGHDAADVAINAALNLFAVNVELFGWAAGSLVFILALFSGKLHASDYKMIVAIPGILCALSLYWFSGGPDFGARYWFLMILPLVALTARGIEAAGASATPDDSGFPVRSARSLSVAAILCVMSAVTFVPWRAIDKYHHYRGMRPDVPQLAKELGFGRSLVLIEGERHPDFASAAAYEPPALEGDAPVYAWARTPQIAADAIAAFPDRPVWILRGPSITGAGYAVARRPISTDGVTGNK